MSFNDMFSRATREPGQPDRQPFEYQKKLAESEGWPDLLEAPTGVGKTAAIVLAWLWRRRYTSLAIQAVTPRRLVYCLPMRVLVEQTRDEVRKWLDNLGLNQEIGVHILMGGERAEDWDIYPEREAVLIGTQDMLLSRALNRGYALGRARWPLPFGLLNNDCLWVFDEVQLMGSGLATTAQLAAFREAFVTWGQSLSLWVSATMQPDWFETVDFRDRVPVLDCRRLSQQEWDAGSLRDRLHAHKVLKKAQHSADEAEKLAGEICAQHQSSALTLVVVNTVKKAVAIYDALKRAAQAPDLVLLHSRFRPQERGDKVKAALSKQLPAEGRIVVSTQVVEAGVDISARVLFTELAPWASLVQRFGRCNRYGEVQDAKAFWMDVRTQKKGQAAPYTEVELNIARAELEALKNVGPRALHEHLEGPAKRRLPLLYQRPAGSVIRKKDVLELFNTTADLTGNDLDVSPFIRETDEHDTQVLWRDFDNEPNNPQQAAAQREELCSVPVKELREFTSTGQKGKKRVIYRWDFLAGRWERPEKIVPGQVYLLAAKDGGYDPELGWSLDSSLVEPIDIGAQAKANDSNSADLYTQSTIWQTLAEHTDSVVASLDKILEALGELITPEEQVLLHRATRWHDRGKAHDVFQEALLKNAQPDGVLAAGDVWAKSASKAARYKHPGFRHELASALASLQQDEPNLVAYLIAAHHGKVRLSIRSMPDELPPPNGGRFARGVWEGDFLPAVNLGGGEEAPAVTLSLECMESGLSENGAPSWAERMLGLLSEYGPFRLAYLEALLCAADRRASARPGGAE